MSEQEKILEQIFKTIEELTEISKLQFPLFKAGDVAQSAPSLSLAKGGGHYE